MSGPRLCACNTYADVPCKVFAGKRHSVCLHVRDFFFPCTLQFILHFTVNRARVYLSHVLISVFIYKNMLDHFVISNIFGLF